MVFLRQFVAIGGVGLSAAHVARSGSPVPLTGCAHTHDKGCARGKRMGCETGVNGQ